MVNKSGRKASVSITAVTPLSPTAAKQALIAKGVTLTQFAKQHNFKYRTVSEVVRGVNKGLYGEGHKVAVALGIKLSEAA